MDLRFLIAFFQSLAIEGDEAFKIYDLRMLFNIIIQSFPSIFDIQSNGIGVPFGSSDPSSSYLNKKLPIRSSYKNSSKKFLKDN